MMMKPVVIGLVGVAGSGKSTAARYLEEAYAFKVHPFAWRLKEMLRALGVLQLQLSDAALKESPCDQLLGLTPRYAMQTIGEQWGRRCMGPTFWVDLWKRDVGTFVRVVADDCRYPNEVAAIKEMGGFVIGLQRAGAGSTINPNHESERQVAALPVDMTILNDGDFDLLHRAIDVAVIRAIEGMTERAT